MRKLEEGKKKKTIDLFGYWEILGYGEGRNLKSTENQPNITIAPFLFLTK